MRFMVVCDKLSNTKLGAHKISETLSKSFKVLSWVQPLDNTWIVEAVAGTKCSDLRDLVCSTVSFVNTMIVPFEGTFASRTERKFGDWLDAHDSTVQRVKIWA